jgi:hypothetical protein
MMESFWGTMQLELLDSKTWQTREETCQRDVRVDRVLVQHEETPL